MRLGETMRQITESGCWGETVIGVRFLDIYYEQMSLLYVSVSNGSSSNGINNSSVFVKLSLLLCGTVTCANM